MHKMNISNNDGGVEGDSRAIKETKNPPRSIKELAGTLFDCVVNEESAGG